MSNMSMKIRLLRPSDIDTCAGIVRENYEVKYEKSAKIEMREMFGKAPIRPTFVVAEEGKKIVGFAGCMQSWMDYHVYLIFWVNVKPSEQKRGIGKRMIGQILTLLKKKKGADYVILTTKSPKYYAEHFSFETLTTTRKKPGFIIYLMGRKLH